MKQRVFTQPGSKAESSDQAQDFRSYGSRFSQMPALSRTAPGGYSSEPVFGIAKHPTSAK
jgi:hypothetical protein